MQKLWVRSRKSRKVFNSRADPVGLDSVIEVVEDGLEREFGQARDDSIVQNIMDQLWSVTELVILGRIWRFSFQSIKKTGSVDATVFPAWPASRG